MEQKHSKELLRTLALYLPVIIILLQILFDSDRLSLFPGIPRFEIFKDLSIVFDNAASCPIPLSQLYQKDCHINPTNIPLFLIAVARLFGLVESDLFTFGLILDVVTVFFLSTISRLLIPGWSSVVFVWVSFLSFPFQLALERANSDLLILDLVVISVFILGIKDQLASFTLSTITLNIALLSKIYPIVCVPVVALQLFSSKLKKNPKRLLFLFLLLSTSISFAVTAPALTHTKNSLVDYSGGITYGVLVSPHPEENIVILLLIKTLITLISVILTLKPFSYATARASQSSSNNSVFTARLLAMSGASIFLASYFLFVSVSYRLVFLSLMVPFLIEIVSIFRSPEKSRISNEILTVLMFILLILIADYSGYIQPANSDSKQELDLFVNVIVLPSLAGLSVSVIISNVSARINRIPEKIGGLLNVFAKV